MSDLDEFKATYFEECSELLLELEEQFTAIEEGDHSADRQNAVFRAIHSVKGGAGAFGFEKLVEFAHSFETLLDFVRNGQVELTSEVITLCIRSIDLVADFVGAARDGEELADDFGAEELARFKILSGEDEEEPMEEFDIEFVPVMVSVGDDDEGVTVSADSDEGDSFDQAPLEDGLRYWKVDFTPHYELYERANDPLLLFRELSSLGEAKITAKLLKMPELADFDPFGVYCSWEAELHGDGITEEAILEVFEFVEGDCDLNIISVMANADDDLMPQVDEDLIAAAASVEEVAASTHINALEQESGEEPQEPDENSADKGLSLADMAAEIEPPPPPKPEVKKSTKQAAKTPTVQSIRVDLEKVDRVVNMVGELVITQSMLTQQMDDQLRARYQEMVRGVEVLAQTTRGLQDAVMAIRAQPVKSVFSRMPRLVRELASKTGKNIRLEMVGEHTEIDKAIIEQLSDPLTHMIRNSADHGVEIPEKRKAAGKPEQGIIRISAEQAGGNIIISVEDDGAGINRVKVLELARERGVVGPDQQLSDEQIDELVFAPGFSTADAVSDISGRGVGMDVVISNIKKIGGSVHVRSSPGQGTKMLLRLPLTLAVLDVMLVEVGTGPYVIPLSSIVETVLCERADFGYAPSGRRVLQIRGEYVQVIDLAVRFEMETNLKEHKRFVVLCEGEGNSKIALIVDRIIGQQQVVIKSLEENFRRIDGVAGGTILGDGNVALIVDVQGLKNTPEQKSAA
ncbi:MAG: chemotaxis protein CheA [Devosiaceae bacterium]|nr:chemotaxis protein CheA [Devosiaceae bacterium]